MILPGTKEAKAKGCKCSAADNHHGRGNWNDGKSFSISVDCRVHWPQHIAAPTVLPWYEQAAGQMALFEQI